MKGKWFMDLLINSISKSYGEKKAVEGIAFKFKPGIYALLGPNGAGKSTLMKMICNLEEPDNGNICFDGKEIHTLKSEYFAARLGILSAIYGKRLYELFFRSQRDSCKLFKKGN